MSWKKKTLFTATIAIALCFMFFPKEAEKGKPVGSSLDYQQEVTKESTEELIESKSRLPSSIASPTEKQIPKSTNKDRLDKVFEEKYLLNENAMILQEKTEDLFRHSKFKKQISRWVVMGLYMSNEPDFAEIMQKNLSHLKANSPQILSDILDIKEEISKDPFIEQSTLSIVSNLELSGDDKAEYYQEVISRELWFDSDGVDTSSLNVSTALAFLKQEEVSEEKLNEIIVSALNINSENDQSFDEILARLNAYYPSYIQAFTEVK